MEGRYLSIGLDIPMEEEKAVMPFPLVVTRPIWDEHDDPSSLEARSRPELGTTLLLSCGSLRREGNQICTREY